MTMREGAELSESFSRNAAPPPPPAAARGDSSKPARTDAIRTDAIRTVAISNFAGRNGCPRAVSSRIFVDRDEDRELAEII